MIIKLINPLNFLYFFIFDMFSTLYYIIQLFNILILFHNLNIYFFKLLFDCLNNIEKIFIINNFLYIINNILFFYIFYQNRHI